MSYKNSEGYADPTAGAAMSQIMKEYRENRKQQWQKEDAARNRKRVYVASPYAGDIEKNILDAVRFCRYVIAEGCMPVASHLLYPQVLNDADQEERFLGTMFGLALLKDCREVWFFGSGMSPGMQREYDEAMRLKKKIRCFSENCEEVESCRFLKNSSN